jgi:hypothetical protein
MDQCLSPIAIAWFYSMLAAVRYFDGSYSEGGKYYNDITDDLRPSFGSRNDAWTLSILPFVCMTYEAYVMVGQDTVFGLLFGVFSWLIVLVFCLFLLRSIIIPPDSIQS